MFIFFLGFHDLDSKIYRNKLSILVIKITKQQPSYNYNITRFTEQQNPC